MTGIVFNTAGSALAGNPIKVALYDGDGVPLPASSVLWSGLPATCTFVADPDAPDGNGFIFTSTVTGAVAATAKIGAASGTYNMTWKGIKFANY